jgi:hypothetical protein
MQSQDSRNKKRPDGNGPTERLDENTAPPIDRELILRCVRLEASPEEQDELRRLTHAYRSWQDALDAAYCEEDARAEREGFSEEDRRGVDKWLWEDANLTRAERGEAAWKEVQEALRERPANSEECPPFNPPDDG